MAATNEGVRQDLIRLLVVDESPVIRLGLRSLFGATERCFVVGEAGTASEALAEARRRLPDVVLMDVRLPDASGADVCRTLRTDLPAAQVVMFTASEGEGPLVESILAGAVGYLLKGTEPELLVEAVERAAAGESMLDPASAREMLDWIRRRASGCPEDDLLSSFTPQERRILPLIARGLTNREIGAVLILSDQTVKGYVSGLLRKLGLSRRTEAAAYVARNLPHLPVPHYDSTHEAA